MRLIFFLTLIAAGAVVVSCGHGSNARLSHDEYLQKTREIKPAQSTDCSSSSSRSRDCPRQPVLRGRASSTATCTTSSSRSRHSDHHAPSSHSRTASSPRRDPGGHFLVYTRHLNSG